MDSSIPTSISMMDAASALALLSHYTPTSESQVSPSTVDIPSQREKECPSLPPGAVTNLKCIVESTAGTLTTTEAVSRWKHTFPQRLMDMLGDRQNASVLTWLPHGKSFVVLQPDILTKKTLPKYFPYLPTTGTKYLSFTRKLHRWGFRLIKRGRDAGAFQNPLFCRDKPELCDEMTCDRGGRGGHKKTKSDDVDSSPQSTPRLTKEALDALNRTHSTMPIPVDHASFRCLFQPKNTGAAVSDTDESSQLRNFAALTPAAARQSSPTVLNDSNVVMAMLCSANQAFVQQTIAGRNEEERLRVARVTLFQNFLQAWEQGEQPNEANVESTDPISHLA